MTDAPRPSPDEILQSLKRQEASLGRGRLKIFLGMAAGVGKTCAMLESAHRQRKENVDVVVGIVESHGRKFTEKLLEGLETVARKEGPGSAPGGELDLDAVLKRRPQLVIIDELAHSNPAGYRHQKRYQDVEELLQNGIDVYTAMNVQHFESRSSIVSQLSGTTVRETVPDSILDRAQEVELVDLTPEELLDRLRTGQIYPADKVRQALQGFFRRGTLTALREMALRITAERVDHEVQDFIRNHELPEATKNRSRLMVAIGPSPSGTELLRWTRQKAYNLEAPWVAVNVDSGRELSPEEQAWLDSNLNLAKELGADVVTTSGSDVAAALLQVARSKHVTDLVLGRPARTWLTRIFREVSPVEKLFRESGRIDILLVATKKTRRPTIWQILGRKIHSRIQDYGLGVVTVLLAISLNAILSSTLSYKATGLVFLSAVLIQSLYTGRGPVLVTAALLATAWNFFYIEPRFTLSIESFDDQLLVVLYFVAAAVAGTLTSRLRAQREAFRLRDQRSTLLLSFSRIFSEADDVDTLVGKLSHILFQALDSEFSLFGVKDSNLSLYKQSSWNPDSKALAVADWAFQKGRRAGRGTETLPESAGIFYPIRSGEQTLGVVGFKQLHGRSASLEQKTIYEFLATLLEGFLGKKEAHKTFAYARALEESEKLHKALLSSISHEIKTPLTAIGGAGLALAQDSIASDPMRRKLLGDEIITAWSRLRHLVDNLLDMSRLESGILKPRLDWVDLREVSEVVLRELPMSEDSLKIVVSIPDDFPLLRVDFGFLEVVLKNLLLNALRYGASASSIELNASKLNKFISIEVVDYGAGIAKDQQEKVFDKFFRIPGTRPGGMGLGLSICKGFVEVLGGRIDLESAPGKTCFRLLFPHAEAPS